MGLKPGEVFELTDEMQELAEEIGQAFRKDADGKVRLKGKEALRIAKSMLGLGYQLIRDIID